MSADSAVTYTSVHSEARSWSIPSEDPYEEAARQFVIAEPEIMSPRALEVEMRDVASAYYHSLHPSGTPPLLPIPLPAPSTSRRADIPEADMPPQKRLLLTTPRPGCEIGESSVAAAARQVSYQVDVCTGGEFRSFVHDITLSSGCDTVRAEIEVLRRERLAYEQESIQTRQDLARSEAHCRALEARVTVLETDARRHEWQRQAADDLAVQYIMRTQALEAGARVDTLRHLVGALWESSDSLDGLRRWNRWFCIRPMPSTLAKSIRDLLSARCALSWWKGPWDEIKKIETEMWNLKVKGTDVVAYSRRFQQLALMCSRMFPEEVDKIEKYIGGLPDMILGSVMASKSKTMQEDQSNQQVKRKNTGQAYTAGNSDRKSYAGLRPYVSKCNYNHGRSCLLGAIYMQYGWLYGLGMIVDTGDDRSFVSTAFSTLLDIVPNTLDHGYNVELADGRIIGVNTILMGCTLNLRNHPFNINLMPVEMGSFESYNLAWTGC
ncbi:hypothetical protein Tco_0200391 [Tanacetum coccineum]